MVAAVRTAEAAVASTAAVVVADTSAAVGHRVAEVPVATIIRARLTIFRLVQTVRFPGILIPGAP